MKLKSTSHFDRRLAKRIKGRRDLQQKVNKKLVLLQDNPSSPSLKKHRLKGERAIEHAIFIEENLRIVFQVDNDTILLTDIITHDEY